MITAECEGGNAMLFGTNKKSEIPAPPDDKPVGILTVLSGPQSGTKVEIRDGETIQIGRNGMACKLALPQGYPTVSRVHCNVLFRADVRRFYVTDVSSNGTWLVTQEFKNRMTKGQVVPLPVGGELWLADEKCRIGMQIREPVMPVTEEPQTSDETLLQLIAQHHADTTPQTFLPILEYLRNDPKLFVPTTAQISAADQAQFLVTNFLIQLMHYTANNRSTSSNKLPKTHAPRNKKCECP